MVESIFWGVLLRAGQAAAEAAPTLLCGLLVAGVMRRMMGREGIRRLFGGPGWRGLLRAWVIGTLLPVCSLGVIPIAREMRRAGVPGGTIVAFVLAAPHLNPLSLLYGLTLSEPTVIVCFALGSLAIALLAGAAWDRLGQPAEERPVEDPTPAPGLKRLLAVVVAGARESVGPTAACALLAVGFNGLLAGVLPYGLLGRTMQHQDPLSPLLMMALALPTYVGTLPGMMKLGLMFEHGNSVGAAFVLFEVGIGVSVGTVVWLATTFGSRRTLLLLSLVVVSSLALAYAAEKPLFAPKEEASHTHAFDDWSSPFPGTEGSAAIVRDKLLEKMDVLESLGAAGLAVLILAGAVLNRYDRQGRVEAFLCARPAEVSAPRPASVWNREVPGPVLGLAALVGLVLLSIRVLYFYYPPPKEAFNEISQVRVNALHAVTLGHEQEAIRELERWDLLTRKLQVGVFLRTGRMDPETAEVTDDVRERLEEMRDALLAGDQESARKKIPEVEAAHRKCRAHYGREG